MAVDMADVIIPTYRPNRELLDILDMLGRQTVKPANIIIMNTEEHFLTDLLRDEDYSPADNVRIYNILKNEFDHGATRAAGVTHSDADVFICMTQDAIPADEHFIENLITPLKDDHIAVSYARQLPKAGSRTAERMAREFNYPEVSLVKGPDDVERLGIKAFFCSNVSCAYRRDVYDRLGGFIKKTIFNEDMIYASGAVKAGYKIAYAAEARVYHSHDYSAREQFRRNIDLGMSQAEHPEVFGGLSSESEGKKLVIKTVKALVANGEILQIPGYIWTTVCRYAGYLIGKNHKRVPLTFIKKHSLNPGYFE